MRTYVSAWLRRRIPSESQHLLALTILVGVVCGIAAVAFHLSIRGLEALLIDRAIAAPGNSWMIWTILTPTLGGLVAGILLTSVVPGARGSGVPQVKVAYATEGGRVRFRDAVGKFVIGAVQIGCGASLGREGPTVHICAGATSLLARLTGLKPANMRRLTPVGVAAGIAAAFNAPIAAVTFTIEEIVGSLDNTVLSGVVVAAALAAVIERGVLGGHPIIEVDQSYGLEHASSLLTYAFLGVAAAIVSVIFTDSLLGVRRWFRDFRLLPKWAHPALGGLTTGILAVLVLKNFNVTGVTGGGYEALGRALAGGIGFRVLLVLCAAKIIATVFSYSSGGAGGIFAPSLFVGAMLGGAFGYGDVLLFGHEHKQLGSFALVGMGAVFAGVIRAPITSVLIIFEMTGGYGLVLPLMLANVTSYALARSWRPLPIYEALLAQDGIHLPHAPVRSHGSERAPAAASQSQSSAPLVQAPQLKAVQVMRMLKLWAASVELRELQALQPEASCYITRLGEGYGALTHVELSSLLREHAGGPSLRFGDVARPVPQVQPGAALAELARLLQEGEAPAAIVSDTRAQDQVGVVTRQLLAHALLDWFGSRAPRRTPLPDSTQRRSSLH